MQLLSEFILVAVASAIVIYEYNRSSKKEEEKERQIEQEKEDLNNRVQDLEFAVEKQSTQLKELTRLLITVRDDLQKSLLSKPSKSGFFSKTDNKEEPIVLPQISPELMKVFEKDNIGKDKSEDIVINDVELKYNVKNVPCYVLNNVNYVPNQWHAFRELEISNSKYEHVGLAKNPDESSVIIGPITKIVEKCFKTCSNFEHYDV